ncbi:hypothetical protein DM02DRAFT_721109 [Periconia macrospinosa]|uniref:UbiA prenyltransferase n=1 Tax=Periconia macrospinosa TaxID=97972 RepID=A0A2V1D9E3_9PLEO|nr:hypothetical protein DM02DRAFT_721109 [Periconia macrospinosa]
MAVTDQKNISSQRLSVPSKKQQVQTRIPLIFWLLTTDDFATFVGPNTAFGIFGALAGPILVDHPSSILSVLLRIPKVIAFNWLNLLIFDFANQRLPQSVQEDTINKPWRPIPSGLITSEQMRKTMLVTIPLVLALDHYVFHVGLEAQLIPTFTWLYNDLGGAEDWIPRNIIIAGGFVLGNAGSLKVAAGISPNQPARLTFGGTIWVTLISSVILTTMHVQDLKDKEGDHARGRRTAPIVLGERMCRWSIAIPVVAWSWLCTRFWDIGIWAAAPMALGGVVVWRCLMLQGKRSDRRTWQLWALWTATLYTLPILCNPYW